MIGSSSTQMERGPSGQTLVISNQNENQSENTLASEINAMSSDKGKIPKQLGGQKKGKNNKNKQENPTPEKSFESPTTARKPHYPCLICNDEHFTRVCPHQSEVSKLLRASNTSAVLTDLFLTPETHLVNIDNASTSQVLMLCIANTKNDVLVSKRNKDYGNPSSLNNQDLN